MKCPYGWVECFYCQSNMDCFAPDQSDDYCPCWTPEEAEEYMEEVYCDRKAITGTIRHDIRR